MATYAELLTIATTDEALRRKIKVACIVACDVIRLESGATPNHTARLSWARNVLQNPESAATQMVFAVLAQNRTLTPSQISDADDAAVQTAVNSAVDLVAV